MLTDDEARQLLVGHLGDRRVGGRARGRRCSAAALRRAAAGPRHRRRPRGGTSGYCRWPRSPNELDEAATRLDALDAGEMAVNLRAVLSCSIESLAPPAASAVRAARPGVRPRGRARRRGQSGRPAGPGDPRPAAPAHRGAPGGRAEPGRFRMHDLLRLYAAEQAATLGEGPAARRRLLDHYLQTGVRGQPPARPHSATPIAPAAAGAGRQPRPGRRPHAGAGLVRRRARQPARGRSSRPRTAGEDTHAWQLAWTIATYLDRYAHWRDRATVHTVALAAAQRLGDRSAQAYARVRPGPRADLARPVRGGARPARARPRPGRRADDPVALADIHRDARPQLRARRRNPQLALPHDEQALALYQVAGHRCGQATALNAIGWHHAHLGDLRAGTALLRCRRWTLHQEIGDRHGVAITRRQPRLHPPPSRPVRRGHRLLPARGRPVRTSSATGTSWRTRWPASATRTLRPATPAPPRRPGSERRSSSTSSAFRPPGGGRSSPWPPTHPWHSPSDLRIHESRQLCGGPLADPDTYGAAGAPAERDTT